MVTQLSLDAARSFDVDRTEKCIVCKRLLPAEAFSESVLRNRLVIRCRECVAANKRRKIKTWHTSCARCGMAISGRGGNQRLYCGLGCRVRVMTLRQYGLPPNADLLMYTQQSGLCAACREPLGEDWSSMHVDHCHDTKAVRGLLHGRCNKRLEDDPEKAFQMQVYLASTTFDLRDLLVA